MALLNPPQVLPNVAHAIHKFLALHDTWVLDSELAEALVPFSDERDVVHLTATACIDIGVLERSDHGLRIAQGTPGNVGSSQAHFRVLMRKQILAKERNGDLWAAGPHGPSQQGGRDFVRAIAWFLSLNTYELSGRYDGKGMAVETLGIKEFGEVTPIVNAERWQNFVRWSVYLGFAAPFNIKRTQLILPDPTQAIRDLLPGAPGRSETPIESFVTWLAEQIPVLDGGTYRREVLARAKREPEPPGQLSASLSHALLRLHEAGQIKLSSKSDAASLRFAAGALETLDFSHVSVVL